MSAERSAGRLGGVPGLPKSESREVTYSKGKKLIQEVSFTSVLYFILMFRLLINFK